MRMIHIQHAPSQIITVHNKNYTKIVAHLSRACAAVPLPPQTANPSATFTCKITIFTHFCWSNPIQDHLSLQGQHLLPWPENGGRNKADPTCVPLVHAPWSSPKESGFDASKMAAWGIWQRSTLSSSKSKIRSYKAMPTHHFVPDAHITLPVAQTNFLDIMSCPNVLFWVSHRNTHAWLPDHTAQ